MIQDCGRADILEPIDKCEQDVEFNFMGSTSMSRRRNV